jgi:FixJ family two-component response regulator
MAQQHTDGPAVTGVREGDGCVNDVPVIAIVDDDASVRRSLLRVVQAAGYAAEGFASAREFLHWLPQGRAACLVLDVHMGEMSGFDLQDRLTVPIIFITAHDDARTRDRIAKSGAAGHLQKPIESQSVLEAIQGAIRAGEAGRRTTPRSTRSSRDGELT